MVLERVHVGRLIGLAIAAILWFLICVGIFVFFTVLMPTPSHAQSGNFVWSERSSSAPYGLVIPMWNSTGATILDGTVVMTDTTGTTVQPQIAYGKGFATFDCKTANVKRIVGVLLGDCPGYSYGRIMVRGFHNHALMAATGVAAGSYVRPSLTVTGALAAYADADSANSFKPVVGRFQRYATTTDLHGWVYVDFFGVTSGAK